MLLFIEFVVGLFVGLGLLISGMTDPGKILGFLDLFGDWDPSLVFVMGGAVSVAYFGFSYAKKRTANLIGGELLLPKATHIDSKLIIGGILFGIGWGISGFCPGPAMVSVVTGQGKALVFIDAMVAGMLLYAIADQYTNKSKEASSKTARRVRKIANEQQAAVKHAASAAPTTIPYVCVTDDINKPR
jgi:hypothetical protein